MCKTFVYIEAEGVFREGFVPQFEILHDVFEPARHLVFKIFNFHDTMAFKQVTKVNFAEKLMDTRVIAAAYVFVKGDPRTGIDLPVIGFPFIGHQGGGHERLQFVMKEKAFGVIDDLLRLWGMFEFQVLFQAACLEQCIEVAVSHRCPVLFDSVANLSFDLEHDEFIVAGMGITSDPEFSPVQQSGVFFRGS